MSSDNHLSELLERCRADHWSWINGDGAPYALPDDGSILGAIGGFGPGGRGIFGTGQSAPHRR